MEITINKIIIILVIFFIYNGFKFINTSGSELSLVSSLFNMIIFLGIIVFIFHKEDIEDITNTYRKSSNAGRYKRKRGISKINRNRFMIS